MARHWHKHWRLVRRAVNDFENFLAPPQLMKLAARDDVESRLVVREGKRLTLEHGPFSARRIRALPPTRWTLLVQGLNLHIDAADDLLRRFNFVPYSRLDDVLVSYAAPGGGVGPHFDSYDVFLLQGLGRRRWRVSRQRDLRLRPNSPLKILQRFEPQASWVLGAGDMLYLPPQVAHDGVALEESISYSIGFRAPQALEIGREFLAYLEERLQLKGRFADAGRSVAQNPALLPDDLLRWTLRTVDEIHWTRADIEQFLGSYLSTPGRNVFFERPDPPLARAVFLQAAATRGLQLSPRSLMLYGPGGVFLNGDMLRTSVRDTALLKALADQRRIVARLPRTLADLLYERYRNGELFPLRDQ